MECFHFPDYSALSNLFSSPLSLSHTHTRACMYMHTFSLPVFTCISLLQMMVYSEQEKSYMCILVLFLSSKNV